MKLLFIYGTLRRGGRAHYLMAGAEFVGKGSIAGALVHVDQYPGLVFSEGERVLGEIYRVEESQFSDLDRYEGCFESPQHYERVRVDVLLESGEEVEAQVYQFLLLQDHHEVIQSGDWMEWVKNLGPECD